MSPVMEVFDSPDKLATRYVLGLRSNLQEKLHGYFASPEQVVPKAEEFEELLSKVS